LAAGALEVIAGVDLAHRLVDGVDQLLPVELRHHVKAALAWHRRLRPGNGARGWGKARSSSGPRGGRLLTFPIGVARAERSDGMGGRIEGVPPDAAGVVRQQMDRDRELFADGRDRVNVAVRREQVVDPATLEQATLDHLEVRDALLLAV